MSISAACFLGEEEPFIQGAHLLLEQPDLKHLIYTLHSTDRNQSAYNSFRMLGNKFSLAEITFVRLCSGCCHTEMLLNAQPVATVTHFLQLSHSNSGPPNVGEVNLNKWDFSAVF